MRKIVSWEGEEKLAGIYVEKGALTWGDEPLAVCWNYEWASLAVASASDLQREDDGSVTANIVLNPDHPDCARNMQLIKDDDVSFAIYATGVSREQDPEGGISLYHVTAGEIRGVGMVLKSNAAW